MPRKDTRADDTPGRRASGSPTDGLTPGRLEILARAVEVFPEGPFERGRRYAADGRVADIRYGEHRVSAIVHGTRAYDVGWRWSIEGWSPSCSCPVAPECKHAFALACVVLVDRLPIELLEGSWMGALPPARLVHDRLVEAGRVPPSGRSLDLPDPEPVPPDSARDPAPDPARDPARDPAPDSARDPATAPPASTRAPDSGAPQPPPGDERALERLRTSSDLGDRLRALSDLLHASPRLRYTVFHPPLSDYVEMDDPDLRCFLLARDLSASMGPRLPAVLAPYLDRSDIEERFRTRLEGELTEHVASWVGPRQMRHSRSLRLEFQVAGDPRVDVVVTVQVRLTSKRLVDEPRTVAQLRQLHSEASRDPGMLPADQLDLLGVLLEPVVSPCLHDRGTDFALSGSALLRVLIAASGTPLARWSDPLPPELAGPAGIGPGQPLRLASGVVDIGPVLGHASGLPRVVLEYRLPDGRALGPDERLLLRSHRGMHGEPTLVLAEGAFWTTRGDPPEPLPELFAATGGFDPSADRARALLEPLARNFPGFRASIAAHMRVHAVRPAVCLDLRDDDWLQLRAFASAVDGWRPGDAVPPDAPIFEWMPDGRWLTRAADPVTGEHAPEVAADAGTLLPLEAEPAPDDALAPDGALPSAPIWLEIPEPERVAPVVEWLASLGVASGARPGPSGLQPDAPDRDVGGWIRLAPHTIDRVVDAWEARPSGVAWFGNAAVRRLLAEPPSVAPRVRVEASGMDWFTVSAEWEAEGAALTSAELAMLRAADARFVRLESGWVRRELAEEHDAAAETLAELGIEPGVAEQRVSVWQLARARPEALAALRSTTGSGAALEGVRELHARVAAFEGLRRVAVPPTIEGTLRPYQRDGLDFLVHAASLGLGVVLADDMGLGKTLQALAWLARLVTDDPGGGPSLVVCPASVMHNWEREAARFAPTLRVLALTAGGERHALRGLIPEHDLVVTNYALLRRDRDDLAAVAWRAVILDEAQNIKNPDAAVSRAARSLRARHRLALTGTPLENRALDLWSIQAFVNPGYLGKRAVFERRYDRADAPPYARTLLAARLRPVMLRRLKSQVAPELPPRIEEQRDCELTAGQRRLYLAELARGRALLTQLADSGGVRRNKISILAVLTRLRQICCHPALVRADASLGSGKFDALFELLEPLLAEGHKVLVFSQFVECLKLVAGAMRERGITYHMLTGASRKRAEIVAAFEEDPEPAVFLVSLKAGGTGLNLTAANYVVLFDPWWNPAVEAQAIDRTHRIGQHRTVIAYRLVAQGTLEERIRELQARKATLARDVLGEDGFAKALTRDDLDYLFAEEPGP